MNAYLKEKICASVKPLEWISKLHEIIMNDKLFITAPSYKLR